MHSEFYLPRTLHSDNTSYSEQELLVSSRLIVVLAEPGGGKTRLLDSLAGQLKTKRVTASAFIHKTFSISNVPIVIDAFDELAKVDSSGIGKLLGKASDLQPSTVILSSRSSEWGEACTKNFEEFFNDQPLIVRMVPFNNSEQQQLFEYVYPDEKFDLFQREISRFDLEPLLPNPQFLKLFSVAYTESKRHFVDKNSIFKLAIDGLAKESNPSVSPKGNLPFERKIELAEEVFAKLLLSGSEGISSSDINAERLYPRLESLIVGEGQITNILATRLFKPGDKSDQHQSVHKIVSEYCAANYLIKRLTATTNRLSLSQCLSIIAPNSIIRDELRGLLGWMAALVNKPIQEAAIDLDPYAVIANGDPSQLLSSSKRRLLHKLKEVAENDPYFRRSDIWRTFSAAGFFTEDVVEELKILISQNDKRGHLRGLLLELLAGSKAIPHLKDELQQLVLLPDTNEYIRVLAGRRLQEVENHDHKADLTALITEASETSLSIAATAIDKMGHHHFEKSYLENFLRTCSALYPGHQQQYEIAIGKRYFIKTFVSALDLETIEWLLNNLTNGLTCNCKKQPYECDCRNGISKITGLLLDRFFKLSLPPFDAKKIWQWVQNLLYHNGMKADQSLAVQVLQEDDALRQGIIKLAFEKETSRDRIHNIKLHQFDWKSHSGLNFRPQDHRFIVDLAFNTNNTVLWSYFMAIHQFHRNSTDRGPDKFRRHMKLQAREKPTFLYEWSKINRTVNEQEREHRGLRFFSSRRAKQRNKKRDEVRQANIQYVRENRKRIETGKDWEILVQFAKLTLIQSDDIEREFGDIGFVKTTLCKCLEFIHPHIPNLQELAELRCKLEYKFATKILYAACLEIYRRKGKLDEVKPSLLVSLRTDISTHYKSVTNDEQKKLKKEVDRLIFKNTESAEKFLRDYVEPQLYIKGCKHPQVEWLRYDEAFKALRPSLSLEWLTRFPNIPLNAINELFELATEFGERNRLKNLIIQRSDEYLVFSPDQGNDKELEEKRNFWLIRAFYFLSGPPEKYWSWLKNDKNLLILLEQHSRKINYSNHSHWPFLTSIKVETILNAFIDTWPKVDLPDSWGTGSPIGERAHRFLNEITWNLDKDDADNALPVLDRLLLDQRYKDLFLDLRSIRSSQIRKKALRDFEAPEPRKIVGLLDQNEIATVEGLRALLLDELLLYQADLNGSETTSKDIFYKDYKMGERLGEVDATLHIAERLRLRLEHKGITVTPEHQLKDANRCDFTCTKVIENQRRLLVTEVKGQWHKELYSAAEKQLHERYAIHPDAEQQGIYLVLWFGSNENIAGKKKHIITSAQTLNESIEMTVPLELKGLIDIFVLDVSKG